MYDDYYVILIFPIEKQEANYARVFSKQQTTWQFLKVKLCDFEEYFIMRKVLDNLFSKFLELRQTFFPSDNSLNTD